MKKFFATICIAALAISGAFAQKVTFPTDGKGRISYTNEFVTDQSKAELIENVSTWAVTTFKSDAVFSKDEAKGELMVNGSAKSRTWMNPFAGTFNEYVNFVIKFVVEDGKIVYTLYRPTLTETYAGYGSNSKVSNMDDLYAAYLKAYSDISAAKNNASLSKKEQKAIIKEAEEVIEDKEESLEEAAETMRNVTQMLESNLFR